MNNCQLSESRRELVLSQGLERIEMNYLKACVSGAADPAVLVLDPNDEDARAIAEETGLGAEIVAHIAEATRRGVSPVLFWGIPGRLARALVASRFEGVEELLYLADAGDGYLAYVVAGGGLGVFAMGPPPEQAWAAQTGRIPRSE